MLRLRIRLDRARYAVWAHLEQEDGQALIEYALILGLIAVVSIGVLNAIGISVSGVLNKISTSLSSVSNS